MDNSPDSGQRRERDEECPGSVPEPGPGVCVPLFSRQGWIFTPTSRRWKSIQDLSTKQLSKGRKSSSETKVFPPDLSVPPSMMSPPPHYRFCLNSNKLPLSEKTKYGRFVMVLLGTGEDSTHARGWTKLKLSKVFISILFSFPTSGFMKATLS